MTAALIHRPTKSPPRPAARRLQSRAQLAGLADDGVARPAFRLVLARAKRDRLAQRTAALAARRRCHVAGCGADGMPVLLVESEREALLCPVHQLVHLDGTLIEGQPMLATSAW